eukprot:CAMPEP_0167749054 /NCGR_PEP_ID=MMETSP0110_2-20121227/5186_1 /TAXON_ID=629695 /ORGANISM="Gymnochlora sp., Strain CCMP2014" /LENGTH=52 /DNA_ID=CAMNT_0007634149 /DNA_START=191 /DNA_END=349 /DNA_ORIENTATION=-
MTRFFITDPYYQSFLAKKKGGKASAQHKHKKNAPKGGKIQNAPKAAPLAQSA